MARDATDTEAAMVISETVHTAFRKGCENGHDVWQAIRDMPAENWSEAVNWMIWAMRESGYKIVKTD